MRVEYLELMSDYKMKEYQRIAFMQMLPRLRKIRQYEIDDIIKILFQKISDNVMFVANDFKTLSKIFSNASLHEEEILSFLAEPLMTVNELSEKSRLSGFSSQIKFLIKELSVKKNLKIKLTEKEQALFEDLQKLMATFTSNAEYLSTDHQ